MYIRDDRLPPSQTLPLKVPCFVTVPSYQKLCYQNKTKMFSGQALPIVLQSRVYPHTLPPLP